MLRWPALARRLARQSQFHCQSHKDNENETGSVWQIEFHCWSQLREGICLRGDLRDYNQISLPDQNRSTKWQPYHCAEFNFTNGISCECGRLREGWWDRFNFTADQIRRIQIRHLSKFGWKLDKMNSTLPLIRNKGTGWDTIIVLFWVLRLLSCHHLDVIQDVVRGTNETSNLIRQEDQVMLRWPALVRRLARQS